MDNTSKSGMYSAFASTCKKSEILVTIVEKNNIDDSDISVSTLLFAIDMHVRKSPNQTTELSLKNGYWGSYVPIKL